MPASRLRRAASGVPAPAHRRTGAGALEPARWLSQCKIVPFLKIIFCNIAPLGDQKKRSHMKVKSKISYLGKRNSILPGQMAEQLAVEVDVKNVTQQQYTAGQAPLFCLD